MSESKCTKLTKADKNTINHAIAHLNGYQFVVEKSTGYTAVAVRDEISKLKRLLKRKC